MEHARVGDANDEPSTAAVDAEREAEDAGMHLPRAHSRRSSMLGVRAEKKASHPRASLARTSGLPNALSRSRFFRDVTQKPSGDKTRLGPSIQVGVFDLNA